MKTTFSLATLLLLVCFSRAGNQYHYTVDLLHVEKDMVKVTLVPPPISATDKATFIMPRVVPGSYAVKDFGRFVSNLVAYDAKGKKLKVKRLDDNRFVINRPNQIARLEYNVSDTWDDKDKKEFVFQPCGSNIEAGRNYVINGHCFFGYFEDYKMLPFEIEVLKPEGFYGATPLSKKSETADKDVLTCPNYVELADNPMMYSLPDTNSFDVGNMNVMIAVYSAKGLVRSKKIVEYVEPIGRALKRFFNILPVNHYLFIYYFDDPNRLPNIKTAGLSGYGALEHHHCSFYYLPETTFEKELRETVYHVSSHEFLHILTPLNIHSKEIDDFDFLYPKMSQHLWLYEGVTEYFSELCQVQDSVISEKQFLDDVRQKIGESSDFGSFSFTDMSANVLTAKNQKLYLSVYSRGALMAMLLDIRIIELTNGQKNLKSVLMELAQKYGPSRPFDDNELIHEIVSRVNPELQDFFDKYIIGSEPLNYHDYFTKIGWSFEEHKQRKVYVSGYFGIQYKETTQQFIIVNPRQTIFGFVNGDVLKEVNGEELTPDNFVDLFIDNFKYNPRPDKISVTLIRNGKEMTLANTPLETEVTQNNFLDVEKSFTANQQNLRRVFFAL